MNDQLRQFARTTLKDGLAQCANMQRDLFRRMYSPNDLNLPIDAVVDGIPVEKLDWAMQQVQSTLDKAAKKQLD